MQEDSNARLCILSVACLWFPAPSLGSAASHSPLVLSWSCPESRQTEELADWLSLVAAGTLQGGTTG